jgi:topoisomerase-4 subunit A
MEFLADDKNINILHILYDYQPQIEVHYYIKNEDENELLTISCAEFVELMSIKAKGKRINNGTVKNIIVLDPIPVEEEEEELDPIDDDTEVNGEEEGVEEDNSQEDLDYRIAKELFDSIETPIISDKTEKPEKTEKKEPETRKVFKKKEQNKDEDEWEQLTLF